MIGQPYKGIIEGMVDSGRAKLIDSYWWGITTRTSAEAVQSVINERTTRLSPAPRCLDDDLEGGGK